MPRYVLASGALTAAVRAVNKMGRVARVDGVPACLMPLGAMLVEGAPACFAPAREVPGVGATDGHAAACDGCLARERCPGVPIGFLARFGAGELRPELAAAVAAGIPGSAE